MPKLRMSVRMYRENEKEDWKEGEDFLSCGVMKNVPLVLRWSVKLSGVSVRKARQREGFRRGYLEYSCWVWGQRIGFWLSSKSP